MMNFEAQLQQYLAARLEQGTYRRLPVPRQDKLIDFTSNDYLSLSTEPALLEAACEYAARYGTGAKASRLLAYNTEVHTALEQTIARDKGTETALLFVSGYQANACALAALFAHTIRPCIFSDRLNHASIHHACQLAGIAQIRYAHSDMGSLSARLLQHQDKSGTRFIVTESLFGMDGDCVDMVQLGTLANRHGAVLYIDEAHATGVVGENGFGLATRLPQLVHSPIIMGTFSKALGCSGGYIACSKLVKRYLLNACGGQIYSTALSPVMAGVALTAWRLLPKLDEKRQRVHAHARILAEQLQASGIAAQYQGSAIVPVMVGDAKKVMRVRIALKQQGYAVSAIRSPTVAVGTERLRIGCTAGHTQQEVVGLASVIKELLRK